jgi:hypothetical protein
MIGSFVHDKWTFGFDKSQKMFWLTEHTVCFSRKLLTEVSEYLSEVLYSDALFDVFIDGVSETVIMSHNLTLVYHLMPSPVTLHSMELVN